MSGWSLHPIMNSFLAVGAIAVLLAMLSFFGPRFGAVTPTRRWTLVAVRLLVVLLLTLAMLRPTHISTTGEPQTAVLVMLFDQSRSMLLPNQSAGDTRWRAEIEALQQAEAALRELPERMAVKIYAYDNQLHPIEFDAEKFSLPDEPTGDQTDIGTALYKAVRREAGKRLAGVILMGDGTQTAFAPEVEIQEAAREMQRLGYPLYSVAFGPAGAVAQSRDVAIENLQDQYTVFVKNELPVRAMLRVQGYVNKEIPVEMIVERPDGKEEILGPVPIIAKQDDQLIPVEMTYAPQIAGRYKLTMRAAQQPGELVTKNNELTAFLRVLEGGLNVLYLEGELRSEQLFLRRAIDASPDINLDFRWINHQDLDRPVDLVEEFANPQYDVFIFGDLDSTAISKASLERLVTAIDSGKGFIMLGGLHSFGAGGYLDSPLADVLPIKIDRLEKQDFGAPVRQDLHVRGPLAMLPTVSHPVTRLGAAADNESLWRRLPELRGVNRFAGVKDAVGVRVLAETPDGAPILVSGTYGQGRVLAMAGDSTWRWALRGQQAAHKRFWRQVILWLAQREDSADDDVWVQLAQRRFNPGARVTFTTGVRAATGETITDAAMTAQVVLPDGKRQPLRLARDGEQWTGQVDSARMPGDYVIEITATREGEPLGDGRGEFLVFDQDVELAAAAADHDQLARLSGMTHEFGGRQVAPEQLTALIDEIRQRPPEMEIEVQTKWQLADTGQDAWLLFALFIVLLTIEWALRKKWGFV